MNKLRVSVLALFFAACGGSGLGTSPPDSASALHHDMGSIDQGPFDSGPNDGLGDAVPPDAGHHHHDGGQPIDFGGIDLGGPDGGNHHHHDGGQPIDLGSIDFSAPVDLGADGATFACAQHVNYDSCVADPSCFPDGCASTCTQEGFLFFGCYPNGTQPPAHACPDIQCP